MIPNRLSKFAGALIIATVLFSGQAFGHYNPVTSHFLSRDPLKYSSGMNLYQYVNSNPVLRDDPTGLQTTVPSSQPCPCWCKSHPEECKVIYQWQSTTISFNQDDSGKINGTEAYGGYKATLTSKSKHDLSGCNLHQDITITKTWVVAANAVADTPDSFNPPVNSNGFSSSSNGKTVITQIPNDYEHKGLEIEDQPGISTVDGKLLSQYMFHAKDYVEESSGVSGSVDFDVKFTKFTDSGDFSYTFKSSDGSIDRHDP